MAPWVPVVSAAVFAVLAIAERFYSRFVPDVNDQKRQLKRAGMIIYYSLALLSVVVGLWRAMQEKGPVTQEFVLIVGALYLILALLMSLTLLQLAARLMGGVKEFMGVYRSHLEITREMVGMIRVIAAKVKDTAEVEDSMRRILRQIDGASE
jgi:hypothetical protein